jgi:hypothetical protein
MKGDSMKTNELTGAALDWAVHYAIHGECEGYSPYEYSTNWAQGGPIIEREKIDLSVTFYGWVAHHGRYRIKAMNLPEYTQKADTPLIAAMRCYVASKLGDNIEVPKELTC